MATEQVATLVHGRYFTRFIEAMRSAWAAGQDATLPTRGQRLMEALLRETPPDERWSATLLAERPAARELHRDPDYGFIQMGHFYEAGYGGRPHEHGPHWVLYGVYRGTVDISTYRRVDGGSGTGPTQLEVIETVRLTAGTVMPYLPGAIHSPRALDPQGSVVLRFLSADIDAIERFRYLPSDPARQLPDASPATGGQI